MGIIEQMEWKPPSPAPPGRGKNNPPTPYRSGDHNQTKPQPNQTTNWEWGKKKYWNNIF